MPVQVTNVCAKVEGDGDMEPEVAADIDAVTGVNPPAALVDVAL